MKTECEINRFAVSRPETVNSHGEDTLVTDDRAGLTPAQMVERKLVSLLPAQPLSVPRRPERVRLPHD
jgi:hypothetical protein